MLWLVDGVANTVKERRGEGATARGEAMLVSARSFDVISLCLFIGLHPTIP